MLMLLFMFVMAFIVAFFYVVSIFILYSSYTHPIFILYKTLEIGSIDGASRRLVSLFPIGKLVLLGRQ